jgi:hypothetical protein
MNDLFTMAADGVGNFIVDRGLEIVFIGGGGAFLTWLNLQKAKKKAVEEGIFNGESCVFTETMYDPASHQQRIRTINNRLPLGEIFDPAVRDEILKYFDKAKDLCTSENPIIFSYLKDVIPPKKYDAMMDIICRSWLNYFGDIANPGSRPQTLALKDGEIPEEMPGIPLLIYEPSANHKRYRVFWINPALIAPGKIPATEADCVFESPHHNERLITNHAIIKVLQQQPALAKKFTVMVPTGRIIRQPAQNLDFPRLQPWCNTQTMIDTPSKTP